MSLYNMINGVNPAAFFFLPMLGRHPDEFPRFRDCFLADEDRPEYDDHIHVFTRTGGGNREGCREENDAIREMDGFVTDYDDDFDETYATWVFKVPEKWMADFKALRDGRLHDVSHEYREEMKRVYPKLSEKFDQMFEQAGNGRKTDDDPGAA